MAESDLKECVGCAAQWRGTSRFCRTCGTGSARKYRVCDGCGSEFRGHGKRRVCREECGLLISSKRCFRCLEVKPRNAFHSHSTTVDRLQMACRECRAKGDYDEVACLECGEIFQQGPMRYGGRLKYCSDACKQNAANGPRKARTCAECGTSYLARTKGQLATTGASHKHCSSVCAEAAKKAYNKRHKWLSTILKHGMTEEWYWEQHVKGCAACGEPFVDDERRPHIDHDHSCCSGTHGCPSCVRGLLHPNCNAGIGLFGESVERLQSVIRYLENAGRAA